MRKGFETYTIRIQSRITRRSGTHASVRLEVGDVIISKGGVQRLGAIDAAQAGDEVIGVRSPMAGVGQGAGEERAGEDSQGELLHGGCLIRNDSGMCVWGLRRREKKKRKDECLGVAGNDVQSRVCEHTEECQKWQQRSFCACRSLTREQNPSSFFRNS